MEQKIALIQTKPSNTDFSYEFKFKFDQYYLCSDRSKKKVLKADCDIDIDTDKYDWIILIGSEPLKFFTKRTSITEFTGSCLEDKFLPALNPAMLAFKPEARPVWESTKTKIHKYIEGDIVHIDYEDLDRFAGLQDTKKINDFLRKAISCPSPVVAVDSETGALYPRNGDMLGISISYEKDRGAYIDVDCLDEDSEELLQQLFREKEIIFHNAKFDKAFFKYHFNLVPVVFHDTMLLHYVIDENNAHGLKPLALKYTDYGDYEQPMHEWVASYCKQHGIKQAEFWWGWIPFEVMRPYACTDAIVTFILFNKFKSVFKNQKLKEVYDRILIPGSAFLEEVQDFGVPFCRERLTQCDKLLLKEIEEAKKELRTYPEVLDLEALQAEEFNPNSVPQLRGLLFDRIGLKPTGKKTGTGEHSTDAEVLERLAEQHPIANLILTIRKKSKIRNTYLTKILANLDRDERLRTNFNLHTTTSGRLSSSGKLNMQQLPRDSYQVKGAIKARAGYKIVSIDLKTAEVYVAAVLSGDTRLQEVFRSGGDFHAAIAKQVFNLTCSVDEVKDLHAKLRQAAKAISFGIMYGAGPDKIASEVTKATGEYMSASEAAEHINQYFKTFKLLKKWIDKSKKEIESKGMIYSHFGRKRRLSNVFSKDRQVASSCVRSGLNFLVQSVASDVTLLGGIDSLESIKHLKLDAGIFALVHDSIVGEVKEEEVQTYVDTVVGCLQTDRGVSIPGSPIVCDVEIGDDYSMGKFEHEYSELQSAA